MGALRVFSFAVVGGMALVIVPAVIDKLKTTAVPPSLTPTREASTKPTAAPHTEFVLGSGVSVRDQVSLPEIAKLKASGFRTVIDLRPDGEATDQPPSSAVAASTAAAGLGFRYVPTPHGDIPDSVVTALSQALAGAEQPVILYCRSGKRAARVWALAEASRDGGMPGEQIMASVRAAGQPVDDLRGRIEARVAGRKPAT